MLRSWDLNLHITKSSGVAFYLQIAHQIIDAIKRGRLTPSMALPGTRELADKLKVNRKTIVLAYNELIAQGWLSSESRRGTFVSAKLPHFSTLIQRNIGIKQALSENLAPAIAKYASEIELKNHSLSIDFNDGLPDTRLVPFEIISKAFRHSLIEPIRTNKLGYSDPKGIVNLRHAISEMLNMERGLNVSADNICIARGSQMGIFLAARVLADPNKYVIFENLTYSPAREAFKSCGAKILTVGLDQNGINVRELEALCEKYPISAIYVTPHHQFPTTVMMTPERRLKLLMLAEEYNFMIIEDDYDHEFHFLHHPVFPLSSTDHASRVIYVGSLSKVLAPGLRVGYVVASKEIINLCACEVMLIDRQGNSVTEQAVATLLKSGEIKRHIRKTLKVYNERRNTIINLLQNELGEFVNFDPPSGGLAIWLRLNDGIDIKRLVQNALHEKVKILPGSLFSEFNLNINCIRLGFGSLDSNELNMGVKRLKRAFMHE